MKPEYFIIGFLLLVFLLGALAATAWATNNKPERKLTPSEEAYANKRFRESGPDYGN